MNEKEKYKNLIDNKNIIEINNGNIDANELDKDHELAILREENKKLRSEEHTSELQSH